MKLSLLARFPPAVYRHTVLIWPFTPTGRAYALQNWKGIRPLSASQSSSPAVQTAAWTRCAICSVRSLV